MAWLKAAPLILVALTALTAQPATADMDAGDPPSVILESGAVLLAEAGEAFHDTVWEPVEDVVGNDFCVRNGEDVPYPGWVVSQTLTSGGAAGDKGLFEWIGWPNSGNTGILSFQGMCSILEKVIECIQNMLKCDPLVLGVAASLPPDIEFKEPGQR